MTGATDFFELLIGELLSETPLDSFKNILIDERLSKDIHLSGAIRQFLLKEQGCTLTKNGIFVKDSMLMPHRSCH